MLASDVVLDQLLNNTKELELEKYVSTDSALNLAHVFEL